VRRGKSFLGIPPPECQPAPLDQYGCDGSQGGPGQAAAINAIK
jgi:hypothetical protein